MQAAGELLAERGFERTTVRDIGERSGVDQALIARYFGGKAQLFIAVLRAEKGDSAPCDLFDTEPVSSYRSLDVSTPAAGMVRPGER